MIHKYFDHCYLINLEERYDRLARVSANASMIGLEFERFPAVSYTTVENLPENNTIRDEVVKQNHWTKGAVALIRTTIEILEDAKKKGYESVLILEDDIEFKQDIVPIVSSFMRTIPKDWEMIQFAGLHLGTTEPLNNFVSRVVGAECLHCYAVRNTIYDVMIELIAGEEKPLDHYTAYDIQPRGHSYCFTPNLVFQFKSFSNIVGKVVDYELLRKM